VIGAYGKASAQGAAYVFTRSNGVWSQQQKLLASDGAANDEFGDSVAVSGNTAVIGAPDKASYQGAAYVFTRSNAVWGQQQELLASDGTAYDLFGNSVAVSGDTAVVGARKASDRPGAAYVFVFISGLQLQGVGSSAQFQTASLAAFQLAQAGAGHWTYNGGGQITDSRKAGIAAENGNLSIVWDSTQTTVWTYLSVDSVVANRAYFARPRTALNVTQAAGTAGQNLIASNLWGADSPLPAAVLGIIEGQQFNAAFTDILPADAKFAQNRVNCGTGTTATLGCLGYGTADPNIGTPIQSAFSASAAHPVNFNIYGNDPITGDGIPNYTVVPIGISPIIFISNRHNPNGLGQAGKYQDITYQATAQLLFTGTDCNGTAFGGSSAADNFAIIPILREPLSGTMNTFEFNIMVQNLQGNVADGYFSQESIFNPPYHVPLTFGAIQPATNNPLNGACPGGSPYAVGPQGKRMRAIGTDEMVSSVKATADSIGYLFPSYGNVASIANDPNYGYLTYQTVDPINPSGSYTTPYSVGGLNFPGNGKLPVCTAPCPISPGASFPNIRNGAYKAWSLLRAVADTGSAALTNLQALATAEQNQLNGTVPDFLPFNATADGDPGFLGYRSHFVPGMNGTPVVNFNATNTPNNGITNPALEAGGDVGGCLDYKTDLNLLNCRY
jgi:hypothetical protein